MKVFGHEIGHSVKPNIDTENTKPIKQIVRWLPQDKREETDKILQLMKQEAVSREKVAEIEKYQVEN